MIIGISGYARAGKDTIADILVAKHGFTKISFADKLREVLYALDPIVGHYYYDKNPDLITVQDVIDKHGWDGYKETEYGTQIRALLQRLGTEAGRQAIGENIWIDALFNNLPEGDIVIPDTRYPNEAQAIKDHGGQIWRIYREGYGPVNDHISETGLDDWQWDVGIANNGDLDRLEAFVDMIFDLPNIKTQPVKFA